MARHAVLAMFAALLMLALTPAPAAAVTLVTCVGSNTAQLSCADLLSTGTGTETLTWNGGATSTWAWTQSVIQQGTFVVATIVGPITSGVLAGSNLTQVITVPSINFNACNQPGGLTTNTGPSEWTFA